MSNRNRRSGEPVLIPTHQGNISVETQIIGENNIQNNRYGVPVVDIRVSIEAGHVDDPGIIFTAAIQNAYALAITVVGNTQKPDTDTIRVMVEHDGLTKNHGHWSTQTYTVNHCIDSILEDWNLAMQSGERVDLRMGAITIICQFTLDRQHENPQHARVGAGGTTYQDRKRKMWMRTNIDQCFIHNHSLLYIPKTIEKLCFPMAFITAQCRILQKNEQGKIINIEESKPCETWNIVQPPSDNYLYISIQDLAFIEKLKIHLPQMIHRDQLVLFNPYKKKANPRNSAYLKEQFQTQIELNLFIELAKLVHKQAELILNREIDVNNLQDVGNAYAEAFQVHIHIRRFETQGMENKVFLAQNRPIESERHICLMLTSMDEIYDHCHSVTHLREWCKNKQSAARSNITSYCDYCCTLKTNNHTTIAKSLLHMNTCRKDYFLNNGFKKLKVNSNQTHFYKESKSPGYTCSHCYCKDIQDVNNHQCYTPYPESPAILDSKKLFVFDIEAAQEQSETHDNLYIHHANLICLRSVYTNDIHEEFPTIDTFIRFIISHPIFQGSVILAHNGGSYDCQFILQYLEKNMIEFSLLPRPGSIHKYLELTIKGKCEKEDIVFKDFIVFMPGSLKSIAQAFQLPISKGDFPHRFNKKENENYIGSIPPLHSEEDYFCLRTKKDQKDIDELEQWYLQQTQLFCSCGINQICFCLKQKWYFQVELRKYCWLDCDVLAESVKKFRDAHLQFGEEEEVQLTNNNFNWTPTKIDPFTFSTQSQVAMTLFLRGHSPTNMPAISTIKHKSGWSKESILWMEHIIVTEKIKIQHIGNSAKEYYDIYTQSNIDGYDMQHRTAYEFLGCYWHGCPRCHPNQTELHPTKFIPYGEVYQLTNEKLNKLSEHYYVRSIWECEWHELKNQCRDVCCQTWYNDDLSNIILDREMFFGGRVEVFSPYAAINEEESIQYHDVCSLYPTVCAHDTLPIGFPVRIFGPDADCNRYMLKEDGGWFGFIRCQVKPPANDMIGLLCTKKEKERLTFDLKLKTGVFFSRELYLAMQNGYTVFTIYEVLHWPENTRSNDYFKGYMSFFLRQKQESEGWKKAGAHSENPTEDEKAMLIEDLYQLNGGIGKMREDKVQVNPVMRQLAKLYLNCLWGKFGQSTDATHQKKIYGYNEFIQLRYHPDIDQQSLRYRHILGDAYHVHYNKRKEHYTKNKRYNVWLAAAVTGNARYRLHSQMLKIGPERVLYCDTDSIIFLYPRNLPSLSSRGLGNWVDEMKPGVSILEFIAMAPKTYMLVLSEGDNTIKAKGLCMTISNRMQTTPEILKFLLLMKLVENKLTKEQIEEIPVLLLDHMTIFSNTTNLDYPYATLFTRYSKKKLQAVFSKRQIVYTYSDADVFDLPTYLALHSIDNLKRICTTPFGYLGN